MRLCNICLKCIFIHCRLSNPPLIDCVDLTENTTRYFMYPIDLTEEQRSKGVIEKCRKVDTIRKRSRWHPYSLQEECWIFVFECTNNRALQEDDAER